MRILSYRNAMVYYTPDTNILIDKNNQNSTYNTDRHIFY